MAHTFDIRFARAGGFTAFLEAPANTFHWKGSGRLSIDAEGVSIAVRRGLFSIFQPSRRVAAADLTEVLREGDALRIEFTTGSTARAVVPFWVRDANTAEEIVRLLPTRRTVEMDHDAAGVAGAKFRIDWRALSMFALAAAVILGGFWMWTHPQTSSAMPAAVVADPSVNSAAATTATGASSQLAAHPAENQGDTQAARARDSAPPVESPRKALTPEQLDVPNPYSTYRGARREIPQSTPVPQIETSDVDTGSETPNGRAQATNRVISIGPEMPVYEAAKRQLDLFKLETFDLIPATRNGFNDDDSWWRVTVRISIDPELDHPDLRALREMELAVSRAWRGYIYMRTYAPDAAEPSREFAERLTARLDQYVR